MSIFILNDADSLGRVLTVDTATVTVEVEDIAKLRRLQVNRLTILQSSKPGQYLIGIITRITRSGTRDEEEKTNGTQAQIDQVKITLIGTFADRLGLRENVFMRTLETVPEIDALCFPMEGHHLTGFMSVIADVGNATQKLSLGHYTLDDTAEAFLNGNKFFQRHFLPCRRSHIRLDQMSLQVQFLYLPIHFYSFYNSPYSFLVGYPREI